MKIAVTGSSGRIGRAIHFHLSREHEVVGIDRAPSSATSVIGDIGDYDLLARAFTGVDAVIHTAALHAPHVGLVSDAEFERINVSGTQNVVRAARNCGVGRLVFTSTTALYGYAATQPDRAAWLDEATVPQPRTVYHRTKLDAEAFLAAEASEAFRVVSLRMSRCFPEPAPVMAAYRLHRGVDARDVASGHALALGIAGAPYRQFILSGATPFEVSDCEELKRDVRTVLQRRSPGLCALFQRRGWPLPPAIDRVYDCALARSQLGWMPRHGFASVVELLDAGLAEVLPPEAAGTRVSE